MKKRNVLIFSALIVSMFVVAGCQDTVGGYKNSKDQAARELCAGARFNVGDPAVVISDLGWVCYKIVGCTTQTASVKGGRATIVTGHKPIVETINGQFCQGTKLQFKESEVTFA